MKMTRAEWIAVAIWLILAGLFFSSALSARADIVPSYVATTKVASGSSNVNFYIGSSTVAATMSSMSVWLGDPTAGSGTTVSLRLTCFADDTTTSQAGCTSTAAYTSDSLTLYNAAGQEYFFTWWTPVAIQTGKYYLLEILGATGSDKPDVYGASTLQWANQCNFASGGSDCTGTPYFTTNAAPDWSGLNATSTALTALYGQGASSTLALIQDRCTGTGGGIFGEAICAAFTYLLVPDPTITNGFVALASTTLPTKFPISWFYSLRATFSGLSASSSANMASVSLALQGVDPASTTAFGNILPNVDLLSSTTIETYLSPSLLSGLLALESAALYVIVAFVIFERVRHKWLRH